MTTLVVESVIRSLLMAIMIWTGLKLLRVRHILAQKTAWSLVLLAAFAMPLLMRWQTLHPHMALVVPVQHSPAVNAIEKRVASLHLGSIVSAHPNLDKAANPVIGRPSGSDPVSTASASQSSTDQSPANQSMDGAETDSALPSISEPAISVMQNDVPVRAWHMSDLLPYVVPAYLVVAAALLLRLLIGLVLALRIWYMAEPASPILEPRAMVRISESIQSPVTIGSGIVLPASCEEWDRSKLRLVLAHELSHVRQGDFYLQFFASLYAALVWISPLGWWLKRRLAELGEALSDRAALAEAKDHSSYAEVLLEFAALPHHGFAGVTAGVGMARSSNIQQRIERILNDRIFRSAFPAGRRHAVIAALLIPCGLIGATSLLHVQAAETAKAQVAAALGSASQSVSSQAASSAAGAESLAETAANATAAAVVTPDPAPAAVLAVPASSGLETMTRARLAIVQSQLDEGMVLRAEPPHIVTVTPAIPALNIALSPLLISPVLTTIVSPNVSLAAQDEPAGHNQFHFDSDSSDGRQSLGVLHLGDGNDSFAIVSGDAHVKGSGDMGNAFERARSQTKGDFIWFERNGKSYVITDPEIVGQASGIFLRQDILARTQEQIFREMGRIDMRIPEIKIPPMDFSKELTEVQSSLQTLQNKNIQGLSNDQLADIQKQLAEAQGKLATLQVNTKLQMQSEIKESVRKSFEEQRQNMERQREEFRRDREERRREASKELQSVIDQAMRDGKAKSVN